MSSEVVIVYKSLPHYRVAFFEGLRRWLADRDVRLRVVYGQPTGAATSKDDQGQIAWAEFVRSRCLPLGRRELLWQPVLSKVRGADLVIVEQASRLLVNNVFMIWRRCGGPRLGFWGHGKNRNASTRSALSEAGKRWTIGQCDWWFSYTASTTSYLLEAGYPSERVTTVNNSIDTAEYRRLAAAVTMADRERVRRDLGLGTGPTALYIGSLYESKRLDYAFEVSDDLAAKSPGFRLIVVGDGPLRSWVDEMAADRPWARVVGARGGVELAELAAVSDVMLMPGLVGLVILDSFAFGVPMIAVDGPLHSPEIDYLTDGVNGLLLQRDTPPVEYSAAVTRLLGDRELSSRLREGCAMSSVQISVEAMVERFGAGVLLCLEAR